jgi:hypothetical protein
MKQQGAVDAGRVMVGQGALEKFANGAAVLKFGVERLKWFTSVPLEFAARRRGMLC